MSKQTGDLGKIPDVAGSWLRSTGVQVERHPTADRDPMKVALVDQGYDGEVTAFAPDRSLRS